MLELRGTASLATRASVMSVVPAILLCIATPLIAQEGDAEAGEPTAAEETEAADIEAAEAAALDWLELLDAGDYGETWEQGASALRDAVTVGQWRSAVGDARGPLEPFGARTRIAAQYTDELPNAPPGEYVVLQYRTEVSGDRTVTETVVPMKDGGAWRVSGYFVQP